MSRLYPGWGSGKQGKLEETLAVFPVGSIDRADLEAGDKIILPQSMFRTVSRLKLPFPLTFEVTNPRLAKLAGASSSSHAARPGKPRAGGPVKSGPRGPAASKTNPSKTKKPPAPAVPRQYCGVMEFSGPEGKAFIPHWMMRNLRLKESLKATFQTVPSDKLPRGTLCRLQPHTTAFLDLAASMDLRELLEHAFRNYSVLSVNETLVVNVAGENFKINVTETQPEPAISLYGNLDLEVDFAPPLDQPDVGKMRPASRERGAAAAAAAPSDADDQLARLAQQALQTVSQAALSSLGAATPSNQAASPGAATAPAPKAHVWGVGRSLNGDLAPAAAPETVGASPAPASSAALAGAQPRVRRRKPSRFAQRTAGSSFVGQASAATDEAVPEAPGPEAAAEAASTPQFTAFTGPGRRLVSAGQDPALSDDPAQPDAEQAQVKPTRESLRERRLRFLENLERQTKRAQTPEDADDQERPVAVGSSLNAIRKHKLGAGSAE